MPPRQRQLHGAVRVVGRGRGEQRGGESPRQSRACRCHAARPADRRGRAIAPPPAARRLLAPGRPPPPTDPSCAAVKQPGREDASRRQLVSVHSISWYACTPRRGRARGRRPTNRRWSPTWRPPAAGSTAGTCHPTTPLDLYEGARDHDSSRPAGAGDGLRARHRRRSARRPLLSAAAPIGRRRPGTGLRHRARRPDGLAAVTPSSTSTTASCDLGSVNGTSDPTATSSASVRPKPASDLGESDTRTAGTVQPTAAAACPAARAATRRARSAPNLRAASVIAAIVGPALMGGALVVVYGDPRFALHRTDRSGGRADDRRWAQAVASQGRRNGIAARCGARCARAARALRAGVSPARDARARSVRDDRHLWARRPTTTTSASCGSACEDRCQSSRTASAARSASSGDDAAALARRAVASCARSQRTTVPPTCASSVDRRHRLGLGQVAAAPRRSAVHVRRRDRRHGGRAAGELHDGRQDDSDLGDADEATSSPAGWTNQLARRLCSLAGAVRGSRDGGRRHAARTVRLSRARRRRTGSRSASERTAWSRSISSATDRTDSIAGTTGSGKSELLRTLVAGLAATPHTGRDGVRARRLQGRQRVRRVRAAAALRRPRHRPRRTAGRARPSFARSRAALPRAACSETGRHTAAARRRDRRVRDAGDRASRLPRRAHRHRAAGTQPRHAPGARDPASVRRGQREHQSQHEPSHRAAGPGRRRLDRRHRRSRKRHRSAATHPGRAYIRRGSERRRARADRDLEPAGDRRSSAGGRAAVPAATEPAGRSTDGPSWPMLVERSRAWDGPPPRRPWLPMLPARIDLRDHRTAGLRARRRARPPATGARRLGTGAKATSSSTAWPAAARRRRCAPPSSGCRERARLRGRLRRRRAGTPCATDANAARSNSNAGVRSGTREPRIVTCIDDVGAFLAEHDGIDGVEVTETFHRLFAEGPQFGIAFIVTADRVERVAAAAQLTRQPEAAVPARRPAGLRARRPAAERGSRRSCRDGPCTATGNRVVQVGMPRQPIRSRGRSARCRRSCRSSDLPPGAIGIDEDFEPVFLEMAEHVLVAGPPRSGKTTALRTMARRPPHHCSSTMPRSSTRSSSHDRSSPRPAPTTFAAATATGCARSASRAPGCCCNPTSARTATCSGCGCPDG